MIVGEELPIISIRLVVYKNRLLIRHTKDISSNAHEKRQNCLLGLKGGLWRHTILFYDILKWHEQSLKIVFPTDSFSPLHGPEDQHQWCWYIISHTWEFHSYLTMIFEATPKTFDWHKGTYRLRGGERCVLFFSRRWYCNLSYRTQRRYLPMSLSFFFIPYKHSHGLHIWP